jgi:prolyl-tRNA synthetase
VAVAPFHVHVIALAAKDQELNTAADKLVTELEAAGLEVLYDDRDESAGVKFADADLIGIPFRLTVSKRTAKEDAVELKARSASEAELVPRAQVVERVAAHVRRALQ